MEPSISKKANPITEKKNSPENLLNKRVIGNTLAFYTLHMSPRVMIEMCIKISTILIQNPTRCWQNDEILVEMEKAKKKGEKLSTTMSSKSPSKSVSIS